MPDIDLIDKLMHQNTLKSIHRDLFYKTELYIEQNGQYFQQFQQKVIKFVMREYLVLLCILNYLIQ